ncbi:MAG: hypothetical protein NTY65_05635 [Planctomycetota bacterium]|nr:hypothetical protein [Planctomycetota bacterium]
MRSWQLVRRLAVLSLMLPLIAAGCSGPKEEAAKPAAVPAAKPEAAAVTDALRKLAGETVSQVPADAAAAVIFRSAEDVVAGLNDSVGPELASLAAVPLTFLPPGAFDMNSPILLVLLMQDRPSVVFLMCCKDPQLLVGEAVGDGIIRVKFDKMEFYMLKVGRYAAFGELEAVKAYKAAKARPLAVDKPMVDRIAESIIWGYVNAKPLAALAKPALAGMKKEAGQKHPGQPPSSEVKAVEWAENLLDQLKTAEVMYVVGGGRVQVRGRLTLVPDAPLLAIAKSMKPLEIYQGVLPETDQFMLATWANIDYAQATPQVKAFLRPVMDLAMEKLGEAANPPAGAAAEGAANPMAAMKKAIDEQWAMADEYGAAFGNRAAILMEIPERGKPFYRFTESFDLKDSAKYRALVKKGMDSTEKLLEAISGGASKDKTGPKMDFKLGFKQNAETIEGIQVDVMNFKVAVQPPPDTPPEVGQMMKSVCESLYGPEGLAMRMAVCDNRALAVMGDPEMMKRAIKGSRGQAGDLAKQPLIAAALARVPKGASVAALISCPAVVYAGDLVLDEMMLAVLPPARRQALKGVPRPKIKSPTLTEPTVLAMVVEGQAIRLEMDMPIAEGTNSLPYVRHAYGNMLFDVLQLVPVFAARGEPQSRAGAMPPPVVLPPVTPSLAPPPAAPSMTLPKPTGIPPVVIPPVALPPAAPPAVPRLP